MKKILSGAFVVFLLLTFTTSIAAAEPPATGAAPVNVTYNEAGLLELFSPAAVPEGSLPQKVLAEYSYEQDTDEWGLVTVNMVLTLRYGSESIVLHPTGEIVHSKRAEDLEVWTGPLEAEFEVRGEIYFAMIGFNKFDGVDGVHFTAVITPPEGSGGEDIILDFGDEIATEKVVRQTQDAINAAAENRAGNRENEFSVPDGRVPAGLPFWMAACLDILSKIIKIYG